MPDNISIKVNENHTITLPGGGTTGFAWNYAAVPGGIVKVGAVAAVKGAEPYGATNDEDFVITGVAKGSATITFSFSKHWEKDVPAKKTVVYEVNVL